jgi:23S rRNA pseudouridine2604 synthase
MCEHFGYTVRRLQRVRIMHVHLGTLPTGQWRPLSTAEVRGLLPAQRQTLRLK